MGRGRDGIWFRSSTPVVFQMYPVVTLEELKSIILRNMGLEAVGMSICSQYQESSESSDGSEFVPEFQSRRGFLLPAPAPIPDLSSVNSYFHMLHLEDMDEEPMEGFGGGGDYYDVDGGEEFRIGHRFSKREAVHLGVKNYNIRRASEYRVVESDQYKYVCRCKQGEGGCSWYIRVSLRTNFRKRNTNQGACDVVVAVEPRQTLYCLWGSPAGAPWPASSAGSGAGAARAALLERPRGAILSHNTKGGRKVPRKENIEEREGKMSKYRVLLSLYRRRPYLGDQWPRDTYLGVSGPEICVI
ncbi:hypothetical protein PIB30_014907 [Stylosanthes scabra]|uniref:Transposase MuDR plant domain-containing protein n=1 Tax=Stylosanthes scabra TaxID=79078 RepID=A0ABU6U5Q0_9FABA|nr:hypothetical protein [Stylosanthes scabra]